jgi:hypothetical protein
MDNKLESIQEIIYPEIASELEEMAKVDQDMREKAIKDQNFWDAGVDKRNTERMKEIIAQIGWPTRSKVGERGMKDAWLLVQHADHDIEFQKQCLELMKAESSDEVGLSNIAYLTDRIRCNEGQSQLYGSQFKEVDGKFVMKPVEDEEHLEQRRKEMGLGTVAEGYEGMNAKYKS